MVRLLQILFFCVICLLVFASYQQQINVQERQREINTLTNDMRVIGYANDVLQAEWAYANGAERLKELLDTPQGRTLGLEPRKPNHYIRLSIIPFKAPLNFYIKSLDDIPLLSLIAFPNVQWIRYDQTMPFYDNDAPFIANWISFQDGQEYK